jgi:hypothetical protein
MKIFAHLSVIVFLCLSACGGGGEGKTDPEAPTAKSVYVAGNIMGMEPDITIGGYWKDGVWNELSNPAGTGYTRLTGLAVDGSDVYVSGTVSGTKGTSGSAGYWKNGNWFKLENTYGDYDGSAAQIVCADGKVYVAGQCFKSGYPVAGYWVSDGSTSTWIELGTNDNAIYSNATDIAVSNAKVYVLGFFVTKDATTMGYWTYDLSNPSAEPSWVELPNSVDPTSSVDANSMLISDGIVYVGGSCDSGPNSVAGFWVSDGSKTSWQRLTDTNTSKYRDIVNSITLDNGKICAGGQAYNAAGGYYVAGYWKYDGSAFKWNGLANPLNSTQSNEVSSIAVNDGDIYLAASPYKEGKASQYAGYYKNGKWTQLETDYDATVYPYSMTVQIVVK